MRFGSNSQEIKMIFDPASTICWLPTIQCVVSQCPNARFDFNTSATYKNLTTTGQTSYVSGTINGHYSTDHICIATQSCSDNNFKFLAVYEAGGGLSAMKSDGVCGLAPTKNNLETNLVKKIKDNNGISAEMFTTHYEGTAGSSWIEFGHLDGNYAPNYAWAAMPPSSERWQLAKLSTNFGDMQANGVIIDAGSSYSHAGDADMKKFVDFLGTKKSGCTYLNFVITCPCSGISTAAHLDTAFPEF
jgi:hypothetical protein